MLPSWADLLHRRLRLVNSGSAWDFVQSLLCQPECFSAIPSDEAIGGCCWLVLVSLCRAGVSPWRWIAHQLF
jgi:hypothetical protein